MIKINTKFYVKNYQQQPRLESGEVIGEFDPIVRDKDNNLELLFIGDHSSSSIIYDDASQHNLESISNSNVPGQYIL